MDMYLVFFVFVKMLIAAYIVVCIVSFSMFMLVRHKDEHTEYDWYKYPRTRSDKIAVRFVNSKHFEFYCEAAGTVLCAVVALFLILIGIIVFQILHHQRPE